MGNIMDEAKAYEPPKTKNIADLEVVRVDVDIKEETFNDKDGEPFTIKYIEVDGEKYRVPISVLKQLKAILEAKPDLKTFKVAKSGEGMNTEYTTIPL